MLFNKMFRRAFALTFDQLAKEMDITQDEAVYIKQKAEKAHHQEQIKKNRIKPGPQPKKPIDLGICPISNMRKAGKITDAQYQAAGEIERGYWLRSSGIGQPQYRYQERTDRSLQDEEPVYQIKIDRRYSAWTDKLMNKGINANYVLEVIVYGKKVRESARRHKVADRSAFTMLTEALNYYIAVKHEAAFEEKAMIINYG